MAGRFGRIKPIYWAIEFIPNTMSIVLIAVTVLLISTSYFYQTRSMLRHMKEYRSVSHMYSSSEYRNDFRKGLILTGLLQIVWVVLVASASQSTLRAGHIVFMIGAVGAITMGFFSLKENVVEHAVAVFMYFIGLSLGAVLITLQTFGESSIITYISLAHVIIWITSIPFLLKRKNGAFSIETLHVCLSYSWLLLIALGTVNLV